MVEVYKAEPNLNLGISWSSVVNLRPQPSATSSLWVGGWMDPRTGLDPGVAKRKIPVPGRDKAATLQPYPVTIMTELPRLSL
jgi:hypothetical protein